MAIVIRNDRAQGRFFRYRVDGFPKSVWLDGFSEILIPELKDTSTMLNRTERNKIEIFDSNTSALRVIDNTFEPRVSSFRDVSNTLKWQPKVISVRTGLDTYVFTSNRGIRIIVGVSPKTPLRVGTVFENNTSKVLDKIPDGTYVYQKNLYTIVDGEITEISQQNDKEDDKVVWNSFEVEFLGNGRKSTVHTISPEQVYDLNATWYSAKDKDKSVWASPIGEFHYSGTSVWSITVNNNGKVESSKKIDEKEEEEEKITYVGFQVQDSEQKTLTIYTQENETILEVGTEVFQNNDGSGSIRNGVYTYSIGRDTFDIDIRNSIVITVE